MSMRLPLMGAGALSSAGLLVGCGGLSQRQSALHPAGPQADLLAEL